MNLRSLLKQSSNFEVTTSLCYAPSPRLFQVCEPSLPTQLSGTLAPFCEVLLNFRSENGANQFLQSEMRLDFILGI